MASTAVQIGWYVSTPGRPETGPVRTTELKAMAADGRLQPTMLVRRIGMPRPVPAAQVKGLFAAATSAPFAGTSGAGVLEIRPSTATVRDPATDAARPDARTVPVSTPSTPPTAVLERARPAVRRGRAPASAPVARGEVDNPFAPPIAADAGATASDGPRPAGYWRRVAAILIDSLIVGALIVGTIVLAIAAQQPWLVGASFLICPAYRVALDARGGTWGKRALGVRVVARGGGDIGPGAASLRNLPFIVDGIAQAKLGLTMLVASAETARGSVVFVGEGRAIVTILIGAELLAGLYWIASCCCVAFDARKRALHDRLAGSRCLVGAVPPPARPVRRPRPSPNARTGGDLPNGPQDPPTPPTERRVTPRRTTRRAG